MLSRLFASARSRQKCIAPFRCTRNHCSARTSPRQARRQSTERKSFAVWQTSAARRLLEKRRASFAGKPLAVGKNSNRKFKYSHEDVKHSLKNFPCPRILVTVKIEICHKKKKKHCPNDNANDRTCRHPTGLIAFRCKRVFRCRLGFGSQRCCQWVGVALECKCVRHSRFHNTTKVCCSLPCLA